jgi:hypothetical protein
MNVPNVDLAGCEVFLWKEGDEYYVLYARTGQIDQVIDLALFITMFPKEISLCIMNDQTGQPVRISPLAN